MTFEQEHPEFQSPDGYPNTDEKGKYYVAPPPEPRPRFDYVSTDKLRDSEHWSANATARELEAGGAKKVLTNERLVNLDVTPGQKVKAREEMETELGYTEILKENAVWIKQMIERKGLSWSIEPESPLCIIISEPDDSPKPKRSFFRRGKKEKSHVIGILDIEHRIIGAAGIEAARRMVEISDEIQERFRVNLREVNYIEPPDPEAAIERTDRFFEYMDKWV